MDIQFIKNTQRYKRFEPKFFIKTKESDKMEKTMSVEDRIKRAEEIYEEKQQFLLIIKGREGNLKDLLNRYFYVCLFTQFF